MWGEDGGLDNEVGVLEGSESSDEGEVMAIQTSQEFDTQSYLLRWDATLTREMEASFWRAVGQVFAEKYVAENYQALVARMDQQAIANLSVAEVASKLREAIEKKIPDKIVEVQTTKTEVYQRGLLGGLKRIR